MLCPGLLGVAAPGVPALVLLPTLAELAAGVQTRPQVDPVAVAAMPRAGQQRAAGTELGAGLVPATAPLVDALH